MEPQPDRFLADSSLALVARRLRLLGYDVETLRDADLARLFETARNQGRRVLTTSQRHPRRFADVSAVVVPRDPLAAVRAIATRFRAAGPPFGRCTACNGVLERRPAAGSTAPHHIQSVFEVVERCHGCGRCYWPGTHVLRLREWLGGALDPGGVRGRATPPDTSDPGPWSESGL
jgi:uncharacterized protein with PIN domain